MKSEIYLNSLAEQLRKEWNEGLSSPIDILNLAIQQDEITLITRIMPENMSGMCIRTDKEIIIAINSTMSIGRQRFTLAHELYHAYFDDAMSTFVCKNDLQNEKSDSEKEADLFASYLLVPYRALAEYEKSLPDRKWTINDIVKAEQLFGISHQAMMVRLSKERRITKKQFVAINKIPVTSVALSQGFSTSLYCNSVKNKPYSCNGSYIRKIEKAYQKELIGEGKRKELLMDGFADLPFDEGEYVND